MFTSAFSPLFVTISRRYFLIHNATLFHHPSLPRGLLYIDFFAVHSTYRTYARKPARENIYLAFTKPIVAAPSWVGFWGVFPPSPAAADVVDVRSQQQQFLLSAFPDSAIRDFFFSFNLLSQNSKKEKNSGSAVRKAQLFLP